MKLCECGCGLPAPLATQNHAKKGYVKGQPLRFVKGHTYKVIRGGPWTPERRELMSLASRGKKQSAERIEARVSAIRGRKYTAEHRKAISESLKGINSGPNHFRWLGGDAKDPNRESILNMVRHSRRRARKLQGGGEFTNQEWIALKKKYKHTCPACGEREPEVKLTADHIVPLSRGGANGIENIQPLCKSCNCRKFVSIQKFSGRGQLMLVI